MNDVIQYLSRLPLVPTATLPVGQLFWAKHIYEVIESDARGYSRAREWRKDETTDVALIPQSRLAERLPVVEHGRILPAYPSREAMLHEGRPIAYVFPEEQAALDAAYLDVALCGKQSSVYVRRKDGHPAFEVTNGMSVARYYYFTRTRHNMDTNLTDLKIKTQLLLIPHSDGPPFWRLLSSWNENPYDMQQTIAIRPVFLADLDQADRATILHKNEDTAPSIRMDEDTLPNIAINRDELPNSDSDNPENKTNQG